MASFFHATLSTLAGISAGGYTFSWTHIAVAVVALFILYKLISFQIGMIIKIVIVLAILAAAALYIVGGNPYH